MLACLFVCFGGKRCAESQMISDGGEYFCALKLVAVSESRDESHYEMAVLFVGRSGVKILAVHMDGISESLSGIL